MDPKIKSIIRILEKETGKYQLPVVSAYARTRDPFLVLVSCMLSLRTRDRIAVAASERLFKRASTPQAVSRLSLTDLERLIHSVNFYHTKARAIKEASLRIGRDFAGKVPGTLEGLLSLPGVGRKTANLVLGLGFGVPAVCVDTHVHRISNLLGWLKTGDPFETEQALEKILERGYWIRINELLVTFGQNVCDPVRPACSACPIARYCPSRGKRVKSM
jgi:endonuclease-3